MDFRHSHISDARIKVVKLMGVNIKLFLLICLAIP